MRGLLETAGEVAFALTGGGFAKGAFFAPGEGMQAALFDFVENGIDAGLFGLFEAGAFAGGVHATLFDLLAARVGGVHVVVGDFLFHRAGPGGSQHSTPLQAIGENHEPDRHAKKIPRQQSQP